MNTSSMAGKCVFILNNIVKMIIVLNKKETSTCYLSYERGTTLEPYNNAHAIEVIGVLYGFTDRLNPAESVIFFIFCFVTYS